MNIKTMKFSAFTAILVLGSTSSFAKSNWDATKIPSGATLSGHLVVRPLQSTTSRKPIAQIREQALSQIQSKIVKTIPQLDVFVIDAGGIGKEKALIDSLMNSGVYEYVEPDYILEPVATTNDPSFGSQWHLPRIEAQEAWDYGFGNNSITIAVTDTGVLTTHQDLAANIVPGFNAVNNLSQAMGGLVNDVNGHGTHVAGCAAAINNNGLGVSSPAGGVKIMPIRVSNVSGGGASSSALALGASWAVDNGARVVSASYSGPSSSINETTGAYVRSKNGLYLYAAGNNGADLSTFDHPSTLIVGAADQVAVGSLDAKASFSAFGLGMDFFSPGVAILAPTQDGGYGFKNGTSMATPVANGVVAMIFLANPALTPEQAETVLEHGSEDMGTLGDDVTNGWGRINMHRSVVLAKQGTIKFLPTTNSYYERVPANLNAWYASRHSTWRTLFGLSGTSANMNNSAELTFITSAFGADLNNLWLGGFSSPFTNPFTGGDASTPPTPPISTYSSTSTHTVAPQFSGSTGAWRWRPVASTTNAGFLVEYPSSSANIGYIVTLSGRTGTAPALPGTTSLTDITNTAELSTPVQGTNNLGTFRRGPISMKVKFPGYLTTEQNITLTSTGLTAINFVLRPGDANGDDFVGFDDFDMLSTAFNLSNGDTGYIATCDFTGDDFIGFDDFDLLSANFNQSGD